jgi:hypothetical protein
MTIYFLTAQGHIVDTNYRIIDHNIIFRKCYGNIALDCDDNLYYVNIYGLFRIKTSCSVDDIVSIHWRKIAKINGYWYEIVRDYHDQSKFFVKSHPIIPFDNVKKVISITGSYIADHITYLSTDNNYCWYDTKCYTNKRIKSNVLHASLIRATLKYSSSREYDIDYYFCDSLNNFYCCSNETIFPVQLSDNDEIIDTCGELLLMRSGKVFKIDTASHTLSEYPHCKNKKIIMMTFIYDHDL